MPDKKNIPVNKGHFELETPERIKAFQDKMSAGWEEEYLEYRRLWDELPARQEVRDYPLLVDLELADICNLQCPMCPIRTKDFKKKRTPGFMDTSLAKKIIDEVAGKIFALRVSWIGESTLHPDFLEIISYASKKGIKEIAFLTNGLKMKLSFFKEVAKVGADWITWSIDGMGETYEAIRKPLKFENVLENLRNIKKFKDENGLEKPVIKIQTVWPAIRENPSAFYNLLSPLVDLVAFNPLIDYLHKDNDIVYVDNFICPQPYQRVVVASDGRACMCSSDDFVERPIGDANRQSIYDIWHGEKVESYRRIHKQEEGFLTLECCAKCFYPRKTEVSETATVNGQEILIENYINRKQEVGE
jgi:hypothetical protein